MTAEDVAPHRSRSRGLQTEGSMDYAAGQVKGIEGGFQIMSPQASQQTVVDDPAFLVPQIDTITFKL